MPSDNNDTIVALATTPGISAIAVIRLSGSRSIVITQNIFRGKNLSEQSSHTVHFGKIYDGAEVIESAEASAPFKLQFERVVQKSPVYTDDKVPIEWIDVKIKVQVLTNKKS